MRVGLVRHPRAAVAAGICYGRLDLALADAADIGAIRVAVGAIETVWTSPARRCRAVAAALGAPRLDDRLLELDFGAWEGLAWDDVPRAALDRWAADPTGFAPPGGESGAALIARIADFHALLRAEARDCVVVSHGGPLRVLSALLRGAPVDLLAASPPLGSVTWVSPVGIAPAD